MQNILIIGDIMIDEYINVKINKIANEAPIPVYSFSNKKYILGGCGNVYQNMKLFNNNLYMISLIGNDSDGEIINNILSNDKKIYLIKDEKRKTTKKTRIISDNKIIFRYDNEDTNNISEEKENEIKKIFDSLIDSIDIILFSDYNKGVLTSNVIEYIINKSNKLNKVIIGDLKYNFLNYKGITLSKPNLSEARKFTNKIDIIEMHKYIKEKILCKYSVITLGKNGISLCDENNNLHHFIYESNDVIDVTGAGDIVMSVIGSLYNTYEIKRILEIATYLGTLSVKKIGTYEITHKDILDSYKWVHNKLINDEIIYHIKQSKLKVIFTNGCFDILHIGHLKYLEQAKKLGDILIVGINSDESVKENKGNERPINNLEERIEFLSKFEFIDFITVFNEKTPLNLIKTIQPDILVKGGDYKVEDIVGREYAKETLVLPFTDNKSTTNILRKLLS